MEFEFELYFLGVKAHFARHSAPKLLRAREWLNRSKIAGEAPGWLGATKAHTAGM